MEQLIPGLFKSEFSKIVAVLARQLGFEHLDAAEDIASEAFVAAMETWPYKGLPDNPTAWLYTVAKNKAVNYAERVGNYNQNVLAEVKNASAVHVELNFDMSPQNISDSQLQMLFAICHPAIPAEAQIGLALRILCGFGIDEIATAFLTNRETINKRLYRAKEKLRIEKAKLELPAEHEIIQRLDTVMKTLYLLFSEGYYSESHAEVLREDLCLEAMRLTHLLTENASTNKPEVNALLALMCFHASRFEARKGEGGMILYHEQDESRWNRVLIAKGAERLRIASTGNQLTKYHLEANIAYWHTVKTDSTEKWENVLQLYNHLLALAYSPVAALNRTYALSKVKGKQAAIAEAEKLKLENNPYYFSLLAELYNDIDMDKSNEYLLKALAVARSDADKDLLKRRLRS